MGKLIKVIDIPEIKIIGKNRKFIKNYITSPEYRIFRAHIFYECKKLKLSPPYHVYMEFTMAHDVDAPVTAVLDGMQKRVFENDKEVDELMVRRTRCKRGQLGSVAVWIGSI